MTGGRCLVIMFPYVFVIFIRFHAEEVNKSNSLCVACFCSTINNKPGEFVIQTI